MILNSSIYGRLAPNGERIRNVAILGHVDHGKTTLADNILGYNRVISGKSVGDMLYMDYRADERERGITMKSSCFSSIFIEKSTKFGYLVNFIDSPGHIDFVNEISVATNLADSALIVIDVLEGLKSQTKEVLRQSVKKGLTMILVLNKIDRCFQMYNDNSEIYEIFQVIKNSIEDVNSFVASLLHLSSGYDENYFKPTENNVIFSSCKDKWAFTLRSAAERFIDIFGFQSKYTENLSDFLWDNYHYCFKSKEFKKISESKRLLSPSFVDIILKPLLNRYNKLVEKDEDYILKMLEKYKISTFSMDDISANKLTDLLKLTMNADFSAADCILDTIIKCSPSPLFLDDENLPILTTFKLYPLKSIDVLPFCKDKKIITDYLLKNKIVIMCQSKIISNKVTISDQLKIMDNDEEFNVELILLQIGKTLMPISEAYCGSIVSLVLIPQKNLRNNSFFFDASKPAMQRNIQSDLSQSATNFNNIPLLQITVQPLDPNDYGHLKEALELFSSCEESVKFWVDESTGDLVIGTDGEINLQKSINDLKEFYCQGIEFKESEIFVKMKETIKVSTEEKYFKFIEQSESIDLDSISVKVLPLSLHRVLVGEEKMEDIYTRIKQYNHDFDSNNYQAINCANSADSNILLINKNIPFTVTNALKAGFVTCCKQGWLAGEPLAGFGFVVDRFDASKCSSNSNLCILLLRMMKNAMQERFQINDFRIFWPIFKCYTTCALSQIRDIQNIIEQRYGMIVGENLDFEISGGKSVDIVTELPVFKSLGIFKEIQSQSSGAILPRLEFSHWEILDIDPNWKPSDFNDLELYGTSHANVGGDENISHEIVRSIKKRKGLKTENVLIKDSNKQRTLTKSK